MKVVKKRHFLLTPRKCTSEDETKKEYNEIKQKLAIFNNQSESHGRYLICVGPVNVRMCSYSFSSCNKARKQGDAKSTELFFVDKLEKSQTRSAFCYSCLMDFFNKL